MPEFAGTARFELLRRLGAGGMGVVYEALDREQGVRVALKCLQQFDGEALLELKQEFRALRDLSHPNLIQLGELVEEQGEWFFTMELIEGKDFLAHVRPEGWALPVPPTRSGSSPTAVRLMDGQATPTAKTAPLVVADSSWDRERGQALVVEERFDEGRLRESLRQLASGLLALHKAGKVHRDIKPSNLLVSSEGRVVLLDFGLVLDAPRGPVEGAPVQFIRGTPAYMAPEQAVTEAITPAADWFSVGVVLYEALVGRRPVAGDDRYILVYKQRFESEPPAAVASNVPEDLSSLCVDLLRIAPEARPNGLEVLDRLESRASPRRREPSSGAVVEAATPFVGREAELRTLAGCFERARRGEGGSLVVQGASGLGKSALVRRAVEQLREAHPDVLVLSGRSHERESVPYKAFDGIVDMLTRHLAALPRERVERLLPENAALLAQAFPVLQQVEALREAPKPAQAVRDAQELRSRTFSTLRSFFEALAREAPLVLVMDDLQWADADSLALLREVCRTTPLPFLLIATARTTSTERFFPEAPGGGSALGPDVAYLTLEPLGAQDAQALVAFLSPGAAEGEVPLIVEEARGHPLFIQELVRHRQTGCAGGSAIQLDEALWTRASQLEPGALALLKLLAVAGMPLPNETLSLAAALGAAGYSRAATLLRQQQFVRVRGLRRQDALEGYHDRITETVLAHLTPAERRDAHERLARAFEQAGPADSEALAIHWKAAGQLLVAGHHAQRAAQEAEAALAFDRAARLWAMCLSLDSKRTREEEIALQTRLGDALAKAGRGGEAARTYLLAAEGSPPTDAWRLQRMAAEKFLQSGYVQEGMPTMARALAQAGIPWPAPGPRTLLSLLGQRLRLRIRGLGFTMRPEAEIASEVLERLDLMWSASSTIGFIDTMKGAYFAARHARMALDCGEPYRVCRALSIEYAFSALRGKETAAARELIQRGRELALQLERPQALAFNLLEEAIALYVRSGSFRKTLALMLEVEQQLRERCTGVSWELATTQIFTTACLYSLGEWAEMDRRAQAQLREALDRGDCFSATNMVSGVLVYGRMRVGEVESARRALDEMMARWPRGPFYLAHVQELLARVPLDLYEGAGIRARERLRSAWRALEKSLLLHNPVLSYGAFDLYARAQLASALEEAGEARERSLMEALAWARKLERLRYPWCQGLVLNVRASVSAMRGDRATAVAALEEAERIFAESEMGMLVAAASWHRGHLMGGEQGTRAVRSAEDFMASQGVVDVTRVANLLIPMSR